VHHGAGSRADQALDAKLIEAEVRGCVIERGTPVEFKLPIRNVIALSARCCPAKSRAGTDRRA
jgi:hypothetical protein